MPTVASSVTNTADTNDKPGNVGVIVDPITPTVGAEIGDIDLTAPLTDQLASTLRAAMRIHGVLVFRGQHSMGQRQQIALAGAFGPIEQSPLGEKSNPDVVRIVHDAKAPPTENIWHVDHSFRRAPPLGAVLRAIEVPAVGGDTLFADLRAVWRRLPENVRKVVRGLRAVHDVTKCAPIERVAELRAAAPAISHPAVRVHPETGEEILFVNAAYTTSFDGIDASDSSSLLDYLLHQVRKRQRYNAA